VDRQVRDSDSPPDQLLPANSQVAHAPSIPHAQARADLRDPAARQLLVHVRVLARVQDSVHARASERVLGQVVAHHQPVKPRARSARVREAAVEASSSTPRPKKAR